MGKRTSDFMALAAIFGGAGIGLGLTSLLAGRAPEAQVDYASIKAQAVRQAVRQVESSVVIGTAPVAVIVTGEQEYPEFQVRARILRSGDQQVELQQLLADLEEIRLDGLGAQRLYERSLERLELLEALEDLDLNLDSEETLTIDVLQRGEYEDERRRRRRRRPREAAPVPGAPGN